MVYRIELTYDENVDVLDEKILLDQLLDIQYHVEHVKLAILV